MEVDQPRAQRLYGTHHSQCPVELSGCSIPVSQSLPDTREIEAVAEATHCIRRRLQLVLDRDGGGVVDRRLFESALARPRHRWSFEPETDLPSLAASYGFGLVKNHPFLDGNKRIGFVAMNMFLLINDFEIDAPEPEVIAVMLQVADGTLDEPGLVEWLRSVIFPFTL